jgi:hypothetical protein
MVSRFPSPKPEGFLGEDKTRKDKKSSLSAQISFDNVPEAVLANLSSFSRPP